MTTTIDTTPVPSMSEGMTWDTFAELLEKASDTEETRLFEAMPSPAITAERGSSDWNKEWSVQYQTGLNRRDALMKYNARLVLEVGRALASVVPTFRSLDIEYEGSGDSGESCGITVYTDSPRRVDAEGNWRRSTQEEYDEERKRQEAANSLLPAGLREWMDETCWAIAYNAHPGFEIDAGGFGQISVAPADEDVEGSPLQLTISHTERVEQSYDDVVLA